MDSLFEKILSTNIINFLIVISTLILIFKKAHLGDLIDKMAQDIKAEVEKSASDAQDAIKEYKITKKAVKDTAQLQEEIISLAQRGAQSIKEKTEQKTKIEEDEIKSGIEKILSKQNERAKKLTISEIYHACLNLAQEEILKKLDTKMHKKLIDSSIEELDKVEGSLS